MTNMIRYRSYCDDRHGIRDPLGPGLSMEIWANTLLKKRIPDLFRTQEKLKGHVQAIQQELNRLRVENQPGEVVNRAIQASRLVRDALKKAKEAARNNHFPLHWLY